MKLFRDLPIQRKMLVMTLGISAVVLLVSVTLLIIFQIINFRNTFERDTAALSSIVANNSTAALAFGDRAAAAEILHSLKARPTVYCASLVNSAGTEVAHYGAQEKPDGLDEFPGESEFKYSGAHLLYTQSVQLNGRRIGYLYLRIDYQTVFLQLLRFYALVMTGVLLVAVLLTIQLTGRMQRFIADPVLKLAETARQVGEKNDYSVRSPMEGRGDELGVLARAFNHMLSRIHSQDVALNFSQQRLESLVNSIDGIVWEWNPQKCTFTFVSRQSERILGYPPERWLDNPDFWDLIVHPDDLLRASAACLEATENRRPYNCEYRMIAADGRVVWIRESGVVLVENERLISFRGIFQDITEHKNSGAQLDQLNRQLVEASRRAGMAEVATGVLHNVGNVLNSVNVSANLLRDQLDRSQLRNLLKATELMEAHSADPVAFFTSDPRGSRLPVYLVKAIRQLQTEQEGYHRELEGLGKNVEHIKQIVTMQQSYASMGGITEVLDPRELVEDALRINEAALVRNGIRLVRRFHKTSPVLVDKHKVLQILVNLMRNAKHAMIGSERPEKILVVSIEKTGSNGVAIRVSDNGVGIPPENLTRIFQHGFTTKKSGHGFGLHSGANAAQEMGGNLSVQSDGVGHGAVFTLELPVSKPPAPQSEPSMLSIPLRT